MRDHAHSIFDACRRARLFPPGQGTRLPIVDRTKEHLGPADLAIVHFRQLMLATARGEGAAAPGYAANMHYRGLVARDGLVPASQDWTKLYADGEVNWLAPKPRRRAAG